MGKEVPMLIKVISILYYISAGLAVLFAIFLFAGSAFLSTLMPFLNVISAWGYMLVILVGIMVLGFSVLGFFVGKGLSKAKNWARILAIAFACFGILGVLSSLFNGFNFSLIVQLAVHGAIGGYLLFSDEAKKTFK
jgi:amino acid transporter